MKIDLREMIGNELILSSPTPIPYLLMTSMFSIFTLEIKFDFLFFTIIQFICWFYFWQISPLPPEHMFQKMF